ncbi:MAG: UDP-N-acetylmuramate: L-alanyl-gamma-D-glutamyl-meso-diaminopimelate ligase [Polaribacter sp.]|jgi:UDP-N-acetylmuramate: L-alanyl-gamma-D-glutamyl-meso-diaminopimelate ligase
MRIHLIATGGSAMHNLAIALHCNHHTVSGSDDEIYNPAKERLAKHGLLPEEMGWNPNRITKDLDLIILGMHARPDNPELKRAKKLKIKIFSYPEFLYLHAKDKTRLVVAGSHGKTSTTSMIMHVLRYLKKDFDYMVGAQLEGFDQMVHLSDAPLIVIEGDEYLSSPIDLRPKFLHYKPHIAIITGIAWDHINVFPTFKGYVSQFQTFIESMQEKGQLFYYANDPHLKKIMKGYKGTLKTEAYEAFPYEVEGGKTIVRNEKNKGVTLPIFGLHNMENLKAAHLACQQTGIETADFLKAIKSFKGAAKRLELLKKNKTGGEAFLDFAHAPSKVKATTNAMRSRAGKQPVIACLELHTFSSLNKKFLGQYKGSLDAADKAFVYFSEHTLKMKKLKPITKEEVAKAFAHKNIRVFTENDKMVAALKRFNWKDKKLLMMSSGTFSGLDLKKLAKGLIE